MDNINPLQSIEGREYVIGNNNFLLFIKIYQIGWSHQNNLKKLMISLLQ